MSFYDFDVDIIAPQLMPPVLRQPAHLAWFKVLLKPIQQLWYLIFNDYKTGSIYPAWDHLVGYVAGTRVIFTDNAVYETPNGAAGNAQSPLNPIYWFKVNDNFIGVDERICYSSQIIMFEYALNRWFQNPQPAPQIYIANTPTTAQFMMGQTSQYSSKMANSGAYQADFMGNAFSILQYDYTIYFPSALFAALPPASNPDKEKVIRSFADKYNLAGMHYQIIQY